jgi:hypothetical protein
VVTCAALAAMPAASPASGGGIDTGGSSGTVEGDKAKLKANGKAIPPSSAPKRVVAAIEAANRIDDKGYRMGGGHGSWNDSAYDCSGAVSYVLGPKGAGLIDAPMASGGFVRWASKGKGNWITTFADGGHVFVKIAGLRFDTSQPDDGDRGPGWSKDVSAGFVNVPKSSARHKAGL